MSREDSRTGNTMAERIGTSAWRRWLLLEGNRWHVAVVLMLIVFFGIVLFSTISPVALRDILATKEPIIGLFQGLTVALVTGVTLVITINQLVLSQELGAVADQQERLEGALDFRSDVEEVINDSVSPAEPSAFLQSLLSAVIEHAKRLRETTGGSRSGAGESRSDGVASAVEAVTEPIDDHAATIGERLEEAQFGQYSVLAAALDFNYAEKIVQVRRFESTHGDAFDEKARDAYENLLRTLELFGLAREHFKTLYFQWALIDLSRAMMYVSVPALVVTTSMVLFFDTDAASGTVLGIDVLVVITAAAATVAVIPFLLLISFVLRIATVAKRTLAIGPFVLRERDRGDES